MLSHIANYLLGYREQAEPREADPAPSRLAADLDEEDWVLVTKPGEENSEAVEGAAGGLEESWFVTPPACFSSTGPVSVETSPLENLLIEHPSMSVYRRGSPRRPSPSPPPPAPRLRPRPPHTLHQISLHQQRQSHRAQKLQQRNTSESMKPSQLEKTNKVREVNGRNRRQRRSDRQNKHSGANNNRKC